MSANTLAVIPARIGSKGIPRKNVRKLGDDPLVAHAIKTSTKSDLVDHVALTTDSQEIAQIGRQYGVDTVIERPDRLADDSTPLAPVVEHAFNAVGGSFEYVLCFQPTVPLISVDSINGGIEKGIQGQGDSVVFVRDSTHLYWESTDDGYEPLTTDRKNRQQLDSILGEIGVFLSHRTVVQNGRRVGDNPSFYEVDRTEGIDIDTYSDWLLAESQLGRKKLLYRVVGDEGTGTGHVYRGITIADHLFEHDILFAARETDNLAIEKLEESNYNYEIIGDDGSFEQLVDTIRPDVVVNDVLDTTDEYVSKLKQTVPRVVNIEDLGSGTEQADAVINALYEYSDPPEHHYYGFKYFCLRNEFQYAEPHAEIDSVDRIMISFGGTDENNLTAKTLRALRQLDQKLHLDVVLGIGYKDKEVLDPITIDYPSNISLEITQNINSMAEHMEKSDLLVTSNGRTLYEAASLNLPMISIAQNRREQKHPYAHISRGVEFLGQAEYITEDTISTAVDDYIMDPKKREMMRRSLEEHDIANGVERVKQIIFQNE